METVEFGVGKRGGLEVRERCTVARALHIYTPVIPQRKLVGTLRSEQEEESRSVSPCASLNERYGDVSCTITTFDGAVNDPRRYDRQRSCSVRDRSPDLTDLATSRVGEYSTAGERKFPFPSARFCVCVCL